MMPAATHVNSPSFHRAMPAKCYVTLKTRVLGDVWSTHTRIASGVATLLQNLHRLMTMWANMNPFFVPLSEDDVAATLAVLTWALHCGVEAYSTTITTTSSPSSMNWICGACGDVACIRARIIAATYKPRDSLPTLWWWRPTGRLRGMGKWT
jgi:hypothetical protein